MHRGLPLAAAPAALLFCAVAPARADDLPPLSVYGFARLDYIVDDSTMSDTQRPFYVESERPGESNGETSLHPRLSRVGLTIDDWDVAGGIEGSGRLEVDFQNGGDQGGAFMQLRHAYLKLTLGGKVELLAGQTWDLISPLFPSANNDSLMWNAGNTGDRRPQIRLTALPTDRLRFGVALSTAGSVDHQDLDGDGRMDGTESGVPMAQALVEYRRRFFGDRPLRVGIWGHAGREQLGDGTELRSSSIGAHLFLPMSKHLAILGEIYRGRDLSDVRGGIGQGVNPTTMQEIAATGGWIEAVYVANERHMLAAGNSLDAPDAEDLPDGGRAQNGTVYAVYRYRPHDSIELGLEYIYWVTRYKHASEGIAHRVDGHMTMFF